MERFRKLSYFQKLLLIVLAVMVLGFGVLYVTVVRREGYVFEDGLLLRSEENGDTLWSGAAGGRNTVFTVHPDKTVEYRRGDSVYALYAVREDPTAVPKDHELSTSMTGIEVYRGETRIFRGGLLYQYSVKDHISLYHEDGSPEFGQIRVSTQNGSVTLNQEGEVTDHEGPDAYVIVQLVFGPPLSHYGNGSFWLWGTVICILTAVQIVFWEDMFRWNLKRSFRNAEDVEPSDLLITTRSLSWCVMTVLALFVFIFGLRQMV